MVHQMVDQVVKRCTHVGEVSNYFNPVNPNLIFRGAKEISETCKDKYQGITYKKKILDHQIFRSIKSFDIRSFLIKSTQYHKNIPAQSQYQV